MPNTGPSTIIKIQKLLHANSGYDWDYGGQQQEKMHWLRSLFAFANYAFAAKCPAAAVTAFNGPCEGCVVGKAAEQAYSIV